MRKTTIKECAPLVREVVVATEQTRMLVQAGDGSLVEVAPPIMTRDRVLVIPESAHDPVRQTAELDEEDEVVELDLTRDELLTAWLRSPGSN